MSAIALIISGVTMVTIVGIAYGGTFLLRVVNGDVPTNDLQKSYFRAGHAHAGVLVILGLVAQLLLAAPTAPAWSRTVAIGILLAAILMPAGFFLSVIGRDPQRPSQLGMLIWLGAASLTIGPIGGGIGLIIAGVNA